MERRNFIKLSSVTGAIILVNPLSITGCQGKMLSGASGLEKLFLKPGPDAGLSVVWHWTGGVVTKEGITADLEGMALSGINHVMWFTFQPGQNSNTDVKGIEQLTPEWWDMVTHMLNESKRLGITIAPHINSSWGPAGGPWITPEFSQQVIVWTELDIDGGKPFSGILPRPQRPVAQGRGFGAPPPTNTASAQAAPPALSAEAQAQKTLLDNYYRELGVLAFPIPADWNETNVTLKAKVTTNLPVIDLKKVIDPANTERVISTDKEGWLQFAFDKPFTLRSVTVHPGGGAPGMGPAGGNPYITAHSLEVQASDDGKTFSKIGALEPMYNSWQTSGVTKLTHTVPQTIAKYYRLVYNPKSPIGYDEAMKAGSRTGGGDFRNMIEPLGLASVLLSSTATVHHLPGKNASQWGRSRLVTDEEIPAEACVAMDTIIDLTDKIKEDGSLSDWTPPSEGKWKLMRFGYASKGTTTGGGLQQDKFSSEASEITFNSWYKIIREKIPGGDKVIKVLNIDSWEAGSQNWSPVFRDEFNRRRGYDVLKYLPSMAGVMIGSGSITEGFLLDARRTMGELISDNFYGTFHRLCKENNSILTTECPNPTINSDGFEFYKNADWCGSEFWVRASQNWKPNDIADSIAGARLYGKKVIFAEAYTGGSWQDHPFSLKAMGDHHYATGINRMLLHVWGEQYKPDRVPGIPGAGTPFNHLNTWWMPAAKAWGDYMRRSQALLQEGKHVSDAIYFIGDNMPCRALVDPKLGFGFAADPAMPEGYAFDSINRDGLLNLTTVKDGLITIAGGLTYRTLVLRPLDNLISPEVAIKIRELVAAGAVVVGPKPVNSSNLEKGASGKATVLKIAEEVWGNVDGVSVKENKYGNGRVIWGKSMAEVMSELGVPPDVRFRNPVATLTGKPLEVTMSAPDGTNPVLVGEFRKGWGIEYMHRMGEGYDFYFLTNQEYFPVSVEVEFRISGKIPELWFADSGKIVEAPIWREENGHTIIPVEFDPAGSVFVVFRKEASEADQIVDISAGDPSEKRKLQLQGIDSDLEVWASGSGQWSLKSRSGRTLAFKADVPAPVPVDGLWDVSFTIRKSPKTVQLQTGSWTNESDPDVKYFSGTATYSKEISVEADKIKKNRRIILDIGDVRDIARIKLNGKDLGVLWKAPYKLDITDASRSGANMLELEITNTWVNRLIGDAGLPQEERSTYLAGGGMGRSAINANSPLLPAGILGPVQLITEVKVTPVKA
jgi:alpha-L-rhamnosidase